MHQIVCVKRVPDTASKIKIDASGKTIDRSTTKFIASPYDLMALAAAIELREKHGGEITVLTLGPSSAQKELRPCLAMGADKAVILKDETVDRDASSTSVILAEYLKGQTFDLLHLGNKAADDDAAQVGVRVAQRLDLPVITLVTKLQVGEGKVTAHREAEGGEQVVETTTPCVLTAQKGLAEPRTPSLKGIMSAKKKPLEEIDIADVPSGLEIVSMSPPAERPAGRIVGEGIDAVDELVRVLKDEVKIL